MPKLDTNAIIEALQSVLPKNKRPIPLHEPIFSGNEWTYVKECLDTGWVSSVGKYVDQFEEMLQDFTGVKRAVVVVSVHPETKNGHYLVSNSSHPSDA